MNKILSHEELDAKLRSFASDPERFVAKSERWIRDLDRKGIDLEISDPMSWRVAPSSESPEARVSLTQQFRHDVESIVIQSRDEEADLARRVEFARLRLAKSREKAGLTEENLIESLPQGHYGAASMMVGGCDLPAKVYRRWVELQALRVELVERNLYLVLINVERYSHTTASQGDLIQEGSAALFRAVDGFDWRRGLLFRTYAVHWLNQAFRSHLYNFSNTVRVPVYLQKALKHVNDAKISLGDQNASVEKIAEQADMKENLAASAMAAARSSRSLDFAYADDEEGGRLKDVLMAEDGSDDPYSTTLEDISLEDGLQEAMDRLSERERYVVEQRFGIGLERACTLAEVAGELGVSLERVRQIQVRAINKLRTPVLRKMVDPYLN